LGHPTPPIFWDLEVCEETTRKHRVEKPKSEACNTMCRGTVKVMQQRSSKYLFIGSLCRRPLFQKAADVMEAVEKLEDRNEVERNT
jgi:hypothetical protein